jgi:hypothetical protein
VGEFATDQPGPPTKSKEKYKVIHEYKFLSTTPWRPLGSGVIAPPFLTSALGGGE